MTTSLFYRARADEALRAAREATLANVRDRCLRAATAWEAMAQRALRMDHHREEEATRRTQRDAAAALVASASTFARRDG